MFQRFLKIVRPDQESIDGFTRFADLEATGPVTGLIDTLDALLGSGKVRFGEPGSCLLVTATRESSKRERLFERMDESLETERKFHRW